MNSRSCSRRSSTLNRRTASVVKRCTVPSTGTRCTEPRMSTTPGSVPNAIVDTGTLAAEAAVAASSIERPDVR